MKCRDRAMIGAMSRLALRAAGLWLAALIGAAALWGQDANLDGRRIAAIRIVDDSGREIPEKAAPLALKPGGLFDMEAERECLRELYRTGLFADIRTEAAAAPEGLRLDFVVRRNYYNAVVRVYGLKEPPNEATALAALRLSLGKPFDRNELDDGLARLGETLRDDGFYEAKWKYGLAAHEDTRDMNISVHVAPGPRAAVGSLEVRNQSSYSNQVLLSRAKLKKGNPVTAERLDRAAERLRNFLVAAGYLGANVSLSRGTYDPQRKVIPVALGVVAGPRVLVKVTGARFSAKRLRQLLPIYAEGAVDADLLAEGSRNLRDALQKSGYFDATVNYTDQEDPKLREEVIQYGINRGIRHRLAGIAVGGNKYFSADLLMSRLQIQPGGFLSPGKFSQQMVRNDAHSLLGLYLSNGFLQAQVHPEVNHDYGGKEGHVFVRFQIREGRQTRVAQLKLEGNQALSDRQLLSVIGSTPGQPYSEANVTSDRDNVLAYYFDQGFPDASFHAVATPVAPNRVRLTYRISEGGRVDVSQVLLAGYQHTRPGVIARQVAVKAGGPLREGDVIETQQRLYNFGIFDRVQVAPQNPDGTYPDKTVVVDVEEGQRYTLGYGFGFEAQRLGNSGTNPASTTLSASPLGIFEITKSNVGGRAQTASFKVRASTLEYQGLLSYTAPNFLTKPWLNLILTGFADKIQNVNTFTATRYEGSLQFVQNVSPSTSLFYRYFYRHVLVDASTLKISPEQIPLLSQPTRVSGLGITWVRDRRDNPADATQGTFNTADFSVAAKSLGSSAGFLRFFAQNSTFQPLGRSLTFARSTQFGVEQPLDGSSAADIPLPERFFAGGGTTLRGFALNQAGPRDPTTGFPIGGLALVIFNQELRFPMHLPIAGDRLGGALFYDAGNVFSSLGDITLRSSPSSPTALNYFSHTIGFGFRYKTPIGPVRLDLGYQLNPAKFLVPNTATGGTQLAQLPHFQFFFNIGSMF